MAYTTIDDPSAYFQTALWTGNATSRSITNDGNSDLQPDWVWTKKRSAAQNHCVTDSNRGVGNILFPDGTDAESATQLLTSFDSDGFSINNNALINENSATYVGWQWKANGGTTTTNDASATSVGTIDSVYQANTTAGFSIVTYSGSGSAGTIAHGLGVTPNWVIIKNRGSSARGWIVYHDKSHATPEENFTLLNTTAAVADLNRMNDTAPTSTVFSVSDDTHVNNGSDTYVAYCFANVQGYSKFGSYTGNGDATNGPFIYSGFKPSWIMHKRTDSADSWYMWDVKRALDSQGYVNRNDKYLQANSNGVQSTGAGFDFLSNGFRPVSTNAGYINASGGTYIYMAFAEHPFVSSKGVPTTAR
jgi:hypothetical protein